jgi:hypothetical protein
MTGFERICFTDNPAISSKDWSVVPLRNPIFDFARESRRPKLLAHKYLAEFDWSLYVDCTVRLKQNPLAILRQYGSQSAPFVCFRHPWRDCVYDEGEETIRLGLDTEARVREQLDSYATRGFPRHAGLIAGTMLLRRHGDERLIEVSENWFEHVLRFSRRDQLSFNFVAWQRGFLYAHFAGELTDNPLMEWPCVHTRPIPPDFSDATYAWLNPEVASSGRSPRQHYIETGAAQGLRFATHRWELDRLANKYKSDKGSLYYNGHGYAAIYESCLRDVRHEPLHILELGLLRHDVQARTPGGPYCDTPSLKMWREYFPKARIVGFDIADFSIAPPIPGVRIIRGDMGQPQDLERLILETGGAFDVVVDDGSHASHHQQVALGALFPHLKPGGWYFIEDLLYQPPHLERPDATPTAAVLRALARGRMPAVSHVGQHEAACLEQHTASVEFYDSLDRHFGGIGRDALAVLRKGPNGPEVDRARPQWNP